MSKKPVYINVRKIQITILVNNLYISRWILLKEKWNASQFKTLKRSSFVLWISILSKILMFITWKHVRLFQESYSKHEESEYWKYRISTKLKIALNTIFLSVHPFTRDSKKEYNVNVIRLQQDTKDNGVTLERSIALHNSA
jgi:hypothetical protein